MSVVDTVQSSIERKKKNKPKPSRIHMYFDRHEAEKQGLVFFRPRKKSHFELVRFPINWREKKGYWKQNLSQDPDTVVVARTDTNRDTLMEKFLYEHGIDYDCVWD